MRALGVGIVLAALCSLAVGDDIGVPARSSAVDYPVQQAVKSGTIAAAIVSPDQVRKLFSSEIAKQYIVVEVAVYPAPGQSFNVEPLDFFLRVGDRTSHSELPLVGKPWPGNPAPSAPSPQVTTETGVILARETDSYGRTVHTVGTYSGVGVTDGSPTPPPPPRPSSVPDPYWLDQQLRTKALGRGLTPSPVAGYLYFRQSGKRRKSDTVELQYSNADGSFGMPFPK
jgi:hypothetical protein